MKIEKRNIADLRYAEYNPRKALTAGDPEYQKIRRSIDHFGYIDPVIVNSDNTIIGGHQRTTVMRDMGMQEIDVVVVDLSKEDEKALNVALNKISGEWDESLLVDLLNEMEQLSYDTSLTGFDQKEIDALLTGAREDDEVEEDDFDLDETLADIIPVTKSGDIWLLGRHVLICGDATKRSDIARLMGDKKADMVFTDPPYNVNYEGGTGLTIQNDDMGDREFYKFLLDAFANMHEFTKVGGAIYIAHADSEGINFRTAMRDAGWLMKQTLIWVKNSLVMGRQDYHWRHEPILYGWKEGGAHKWFGGRKQDTIIDYPEGVTVSNTASGSIIALTVGLQTVAFEVPSYSVLYAGDDAGTSVWRIEKPKKNGEHPTMKPIKLMARAIKNSCRANGIIMDLFGGSGSTLIAAEQTGRTAYCSELDPIYCDVIINRWEQLTKLKAVRA